jgi:cellulose synthase/poly-beta-1,6-N-acetylglucosamine synthase-like glycosyltransferase
MEHSHVLLSLFFLTSVTTVPYLLYLLTISLAAALSRRPKPGEGPPHRRFLVVIPAHDEERGIAETVRSCLAVNYPRELFEVLVVADNCADRTAELARQGGAMVLERSHPTDRSKGHALKWMFDQAARSGQLDRVDAVVIIDADSVADPDLLRVLGRDLDRGHDWIQVFDTVANSDATWRTRLLAYSFGLINGVFLLGQSALGLSAAFRGNGMCFSTRGLRRCPWSTSGLVEDLEYSWTLRIAGEKIAFAPDVSVRATMLTEGGPGADTQRQRWEVGRAELKKRMLGPLLGSRHLEWVAKITAVIELTMPTLIVLSSILAVSLLLAAILMVTDPNASRQVPFLLLLSIDVVGLCGLLLYLTLPFFRFSLRWKVLTALLHLPSYALWKLPMAFRSRPTRWIRTPREPRDRPLAIAGTARLSPVSSDSGSATAKQLMRSAENGG